MLAKQNQAKRIQVEVQADNQENKRDYKGGMLDKSQKRSANEKMRDLSKGEGNQLDGQHKDRQQQQEKKEQDDGEEQKSKSQTPQHIREHLKIPSQYMQVPKNTLPFNLDPELHLPQNTRMQQLFYEVNSIVYQMVEKLEYLYEMQGIQCYANVYFNTLLKIVMPVEILTYLQFGNCTNEFKDQVKAVLGEFFQSNSNYRSETANQGQTNSHKQLSQLSSQHKNKNYSQAQSTHMHPSTSSKNTDNFNEQYSSLFQRSEEGKRGKKTLLNPQLQNKLCQWVISQAKANRMPTRKDLVYQARKLAKNDHSFKGSTGWCQHFLYRYPHIRKYILKTKIYLPTPPILTQLNPPPIQMPIQPQKPQLTQLYKNTMRITDARFQRFSQGQSKLVQQKPINYPMQPIHPSQMNLMPPNPHQPYLPQQPMPSHMGHLNPRYPMRPDNRFYNGNVHVNPNMQMVGNMNNYMNSNMSVNRSMNHVMQSQRSNRNMFMKSGSRPMANSSRTSVQNPVVEQEEESYQSDSVLETQKQQN